MVVSQRDGLRKDTRSEAKVTNRRPDVEPPRRAPHTDTAAPGAPGHEAAQQGGARRSWRPLRGLLRLRTFAALRHREFRLLWSGQAATAMAMWMDQVVRGWLMYELTNSPVQLGLVHGVQAIPILVLSPVAGSVADRYPRKQQVVVAQVLAGVMYAVLALLIMTRPHPALARVRDGLRDGHRPDVSSTSPGGHGRRCGAALPPDQRHRPHLHHV